MSTRRSWLFSASLLFFLVAFVAGCRPLPAASTPIPPPPTSTPTPGPLTDSEVVTLLTAELVARNIDAATVRISINPEARTGSVRFTSSYDWASQEYNAQSIIAVMLICRAMLRVKPPVDGGLQVSIIPQGDQEVGLHAISIEDSALRAWADGSLTEQEFVANWTIGVMTKE